MYQDLERERHKNRCEACDHQQLQQMEKNPTVRELRDKIERLNFRLSECKNENQLLKRNLNHAKQMMCKEAGEGATEFNTIHKYGSESGWKGRMDNVLLLSTQVQELQNHLKQIEGEPPEAVIEDSARKRLTSERKAFWRMELERRQAREKAMKEMDPVVKECAELRKKLDAEKSRFRELNREVNLLRNDLRIQVEKNEDEMGLVKSFQTLENQIQETQSEISEIRDELVGFKSRNDKLGIDISSIKEEIRVLQDKTMDNNILIDTLTGKHKQIQETIEAEKALVQQNANRYNEELTQMMENCKDIEEMFYNIQNITHEKVNMVRDLESIVNTGLSECQDEGDDRKPFAESPITSKEKDLTDTENADPNDSPCSTKPESDPKTKNLMIECAKYRSLIEAANIESDRLSYLTSVQENRLNEVSVEVVETGRLITQKSQEKKELLEKVMKLQRGLSEKRKKLSATNKDAGMDLRLKIEAQKEENEFLRHFLKVTLENKVQDMYLYKSFVGDTKSFFENALAKVKDVVQVTEDSQAKINSDTDENRDVGPNE